MSSMEKEQGITRAEIARHGVYFSHETATHSSPSASCAANEIYGLRKVHQCTQPGPGSNQRTVGVR